MDCGALCHNGNIRVSVGYTFAEWGGCLLQCEQVVDSEHLRGKEAIERIKAEHSATA